MNGEDKSVKNRVEKRLSTGSLAIHRNLLC